MRNKIIVVIGLCLLALSTKSQQENIFSLSIFTKNTLNPAYTGNDAGIEGYILYRKGLAGIEGSPTNAVVGVQTPIKSLKSGIGLRFNIDKLGFETKNSVYADYSYKLDLNKINNQYLRFGLTIGFIQQDIDATKFKFREQNSTLKAELTGLKPKMNFDAGFGIMYNYKLFEVGIAASHLSEPEIELKTNGTKLLKYTLKRNYTSIIGIQKGIADNIIFKPYLVFNTDLSNFQWHLHTVVDFNGDFFTGLGYRKDALTFMFGLKLKYGVDFSVSYDVYLNKVGSSANCMEASIKYNFDFNNKKNKRIRVNRFL